MSIADITKFAANNFSRDNRFIVAGRAIPADQGLNALVQQASLPQLAFHTAMWRNIGVGIKYPYDLLFNEVSVTFIDTADMKIQKFYVEWIDQMYDRDTRGWEFKDSYVRDMTIDKLDRNNNSVMQYYLNDCYPTNISDVSLNTGGQNSLTNLTITFSYTDWEIK